MNKAEEIFDGYLSDSGLGKLFWRTKHSDRIKIAVTGISDSSGECDSVEVLERTTLLFCVLDDMPSAVYVYEDGCTEIYWHTDPNSAELHYHRPIESGPAVIRITPDGTRIVEYWLHGRQLMDQY